MQAPLSHEVLARAVSGPSVWPSAEPWPGDFAPAAVVVPVRWVPRATVTVVERAATLADHAGELGFPGGKPLPGEALAGAALRELEEELGVRPADVELLGALTPIPVVTGKYLITPFVGVLREGAEPRVTSGELVDLVHVPLESFLEGASPIFGCFTDFRGSRLLLPHFRFGSRVLFGASAIILFELLSRVARELGATLPEISVEAVRPWEARYPP